MDAVHAPTDVDVLCERLRFGDYAPIREQIHSENTLSLLAHRFKNSGDERRILRELLRELSVAEYNKHLDWNVGSILQHFDPIALITEFSLIDKKFYLYDSIGLSWLFGELKVKSPVVSEFLWGVTENARNRDAWWRAAFSLERLGEGNAIVILKHSLKKDGLRPLEHYLATLNNKDSIIGVLVHTNRLNLDTIIRPAIRSQFLNSADVSRLINCAWLIGRLRLIDKEIFRKLSVLLNDTANYELQYYVLFSIQENVTEAFSGLLTNLSMSQDVLIRKLAVRGLGCLGDYSALPHLETLLLNETAESVISELSQAIYALKNHVHRHRSLIARNSYEGENGLIVDENDKWYGDPSIYDMFSESEDPANVVFTMIKNRLLHERIRIVNPVDIATGTGRTFMQILQNIDYEGTLFGVDINIKMCEFLQKKILRQRRYVSDVQVICSPIAELPQNLSVKSSFVISSFGFPSRTFDKTQTLLELKAVYDVLVDDGILVTVGWDETFNDELNNVWYKFVPDRIIAENFEGWREERVALLSGARNCDLQWYKRGISVPLQFSSVKDAAFVMGHLFGRDAVTEIVREGRAEWGMSIGVTWNTRSEIKKILQEANVLERD